VTRPTGVIVAGPLSNCAVSPKRKVENFPGGNCYDVGCIVGDLSKACPTTSFGIPTPTDDSAIGFKSQAMKDVGAHCNDIVQICRPLALAVRIVAPGDNLTFACHHKAVHTARGDGHNIAQPSG